MGLLGTLWRKNKSNQIKSNRNAAQRAIMSVADFREMEFKRYITLEFRRAPFDAVANRRKADLLCRIRSHPIHRYLGYKSSRFRLADEV